MVRYVAKQAESDEKVDNSLDYIDNTRLEEIVKLFIQSNWEQREQMYNKIIKL